MSSRRYKEEDIEFIKRVVKESPTRSEAVEIIANKFSISQSTASSYLIPRYSGTSRVNRSVKRVISENYEDMLRVISKNPNNLRRTFKYLDNRYGLAKGTISTYWYKGGDAPENELSEARMNGKVFMVLGSNKGFMNRKNCSKNSEANTMEAASFIKRILKIFLNKIKG